MFERLKNEYKAVMFGRNGMDSLNRALLLFAVIIAALQFVFTLVTGRPGGMYAAAAGLIVVAVFRFFSRNTYKRGAENMMFSQLWAGIKQRRQMNKANQAQNPYRQNPYRAKPTGAKATKESKEAARRTKVVTCQKCGQKLRVPKGKGKIRVFCKNCGEAFEAKS